MLLAYAPLEMQPSNYNTKAPVTKEYLLPKTEDKNWSSFNNINNPSIGKLIENQIKRNIIQWLDSIYPIVKNNYSEIKLENLLNELLNNLVSSKVTDPLFIKTPESLLIKGIKDETLFHLEVFPDEDFETGYDAKINIVKNRELLMHSSGTISELFGKF
ncbi:MAG: hypothetical protein CFE22_02575 [Cytophagaceae bacterium BCCC1]|nr:MAG: hypothetical protein CFE22_02575 [Cytophagaceae bacterium BCCC1]